jgi:pimeloyl-ACP methyl ester carboxylesterase
MKESGTIECSDGSKVAFFEGGDTSSPALFFIHGNSLSASIFSQQFEDAQLKKFHLIAFDLPGHGNSEGPKDSEQGYALNSLVRTVEYVFQHFNKKTSIAVGFSLGAHLLMENIHSPQLFEGAFLFGYPPLSDIADLARAAGDNPALKLVFQETLSSNDIDVIVKEYINGENTVSANSIKKMIEHTDPHFRSVLGRSASNGLVVNEIHILESFRNPVALIQFQNDMITADGYMNHLALKNLWKGKIHKINNALHCGFIDQQLQFNELLHKYAQEIFESDR